MISFIGMAFMMVSVWVYAFMELPAEIANKKKIKRVRDVLALIGMLCLFVEIFIFPETPK